MSYICGVDPGLSGAICLMLPPGGVTYVDKNEPTPEPIIIMDMPTHEITVNGKKKKQLDLYTLGRFFDKHSKLITKAFVEKPNAMPGQGVSSCFNFGFNCGAIQGIIAANFIPMELVHPASWKKYMSLTKDKDSCRLKASQIAPQHAHYWSRAKDDGRAESFLLVMYGLKKY